MKYARGGMTSLDYLMEIQRLENELKKYEWVSVKDRLPKSRQIVLMYIKSKEKNTEDAYAIGFLNSVDFKWHTADLYNDIDCREEVTHWMPLPTPPEREDDAE